MSAEDQLKGGHLIANMRSARLGGMYPERDMAQHKRLAQHNQDTILATPFGVDTLINRAVGTRQAPVFAPIQTLSQALCN